LNKSKGRIWPYAIGGSIVMVFGFCVATIMVTGSVPVEKSDAYMMAYQEADAQANALIEARIAFDKKYKIEYVTDGISADSCDIKYKVTDLNSSAVNNALINIVLTRPDVHMYDQNLNNPIVQDGIYTFTNVKLPEKGRWDIMAKVSVANVTRYFNIKADTRIKEAVEY